MASESISIPILAPGADTAARNIRQVGDAAAGTGAKLDVAAASLESFNLAAAKSSRADQTLIASRRAHAKADALLSDAERVLGGQATKTTKLFSDQGRSLASTAAAAGKAGSAASALAGTGGIGGGGLAAVAAAAVVAAPVLVVAGAGLGAFALAALGAGRNSKQFKAELAPLKADVASFQARLQPTVLADFAQATAVARIGLHGLEPAAAGAGKALGSVLGSIGQELQSQEFIQFFQFLGQQAGPDVRLLGQTFTDLLRVVPPVVEGLHNVSVEAFHDVDGILKLIHGVELLVAEEHKLQVAASNSGGWLGRFAHAAGQAFTELVPGGAGVKHLAGELGRLGATGNLAAHGTAAAALGAARAGPPFFSLGKAVSILNTDMTTLVGNLLTLQGDDVAWQQSLQAAKKQLDSNTAGLAGNSRAALANKAAVIASTNSAIQFASEQLSLGRNLDGASRTVQAQIKWLQGLHDKSALVRQEIAALRAEEAKLAAQRINQTVNVQGLGHWSVSQSLAPGAGHRRAAGGILRGPGGPTSDSIPLWGSTGEYMVKAAAVSKYGAGLFDSLNSMKLASGGIVGSYGGNVAGLAPWISRNDAATIRLIDAAVASATAAGIKAAIAAARSAAAPGSQGGPTSASAVQAQAYARSRLGAFGWGAGEMGPLIALWNQESGWNRFARNPTSGAYGIPQALPPGKMGAAANPPLSSAAAQINWGLGYIRSVYGSPAAAEAHELAVHWYGSGLQGGVFTLPTLIGVGERGAERVSVTPMVVPNRGGAAQNVVLEIRANDSETTQFLLGILRKAVRTHGGGDVQAALGRL
jgi:hypothetical protein